MYKLGHLENNGQNQDVSQCITRDVFTGHNMSNTSCSLSSPTSDNTPKSSTTSVLRRWRRPDPHDSSTKNVLAKDVSTILPTKYVNPATDPEEKQMNQVGNYETSSSGSDYSMFVPQLSPLVPQSTARPYDSTKYLPHVQYGDNGGYTRTSPAVPQTKEKPVQNSYFLQESTNQEVHFRSPSYPVQNTPPLAHSGSQKCILPNENNCPTNQKIPREYGYPHRDYSVVAHNYSPQKITGESKISPQGVTDDPNYCLSKGGYVQDRLNYSLQNVDRRVSPTKSPIYRNYPTQNYATQNSNYYMEKPTCASQKQFVQNYNQNYVVKNHLTNTQDPKQYRNVNTKKCSPPFPILEQRLNQGEPNYCADYTAQGYYPTKYGPVMFSRTSPMPKIVRENYIPPNVHHNPKIPPQEVMIPPNYTFPNKYYQQNQGQEWKLPKEYEQNMYLSQMNQMHARLPHNTGNKTADLPRDLSYVDQNQRLHQKNRIYESPVEHLQYTGKSVVPVTQKSPKMVGYNISDQRTPETDYLRPCGTVMKTNDYQRSKVNEYGPVIQSVKSAELSRDYVMHQQACDQQTYACSPPLVQNSRNPPPYPVGYPRQSNIKMNEMPARNISPRRTFQENMPVVVFSPQHIGLPKSSPNQMYPSEYPNQHYPGYYPREPVYPSGVKPGIHQYPVDQTKYTNIQVNRNIPQQRYYGFPEHQYYQPKHPDFTDKINYANMYRSHYNPNLPEHLQQNAARTFESDYRNTASSYNDFESNDRSVYSKKDSDIGKSLKEFLESWEDDEEIVANLPDLVLCNNIPPDKQKFASDEASEASEASKSSSDEDNPKENEAENQPLYILGSTNISSEALPQYLAVYEQVDKLPDNIKGFYKEPSSNNIEETQPTVENTEKPVENAEPKSVIRESLSPHDLTVNKNREEEKTDEEEVLNLSTNRNKENNEFLVEEYSNASDSSAQESLEKEITTEPDTNYFETEKSPETSSASSPEEVVDKIVEPTEDKQEPAKDDSTQKITEENLQENKTIATIVEEINEITDEDAEKSPMSKCHDLYDPLTESKPTESEIEDELLEKEEEKNKREEENGEEEQPIVAENIPEKSLTTSVIVQNTFFDNASLSNKNDQLDKAKLTEDPEESKNDIIPEIQAEESKDNLTEIVENNTDALNKNTNGLEQIEDDDIILHISDSEAEEDEIKNSFDVFDFDTTIIPPNEDKLIENQVANEIEDRQEEIEPISFDNLINSPENIEMKDDETNIDFDNSTQGFSEIKSSPSTPKGIDHSLSQSSFDVNISETLLENDAETSMLEEVAETTEEANTETENSVLTEAVKECLPQNDFENVPEQTNSANIEKIEEEVTSENLETKAIEDNEVSKCSSDEESPKENEEEINGTCIYLPSLSSIADYDITEDIEEIVPSSTDYTNVEVNEIKEPTINHLVEEEIKPSSSHNTDTEENEESTIHSTDKEQLEPDSIDYSKVGEIEDEEQIKPISTDDSFTENKQIIDTNIEIVDYIEDIKEEIEEPEEMELDDLQKSEVPVESDKHFESTVDKFIITNVETIQDDSTDSIIEEEATTEFTADIMDSPTEEIKSASEETNILIEVQELTVPAAPEREDTKQNEDDTLEECSNFSKDDAEEEYAHLIEIENSADILTEKELPEINNEDIIVNPEKSKKENINFDFSYLESCTDNICEKHEDRTVDLSNNISENKLKLTVNKKEFCNNLKSILDSSESESENSKEILKEELLKTPDDGIDNQSKTEENVISEKSPAEIIDETEQVESLFPETEDHECNEENTETVPESQILNPEVELTTVETDLCASEIQPSTPEIQPSTPEIQPSTPEIQPSTPENEPESFENSSQESSTYPESPENIIERVPVEAVQRKEVIFTDPVIVTQGESSKDNIILPENLACILLYEVNQPYFILDPDSNEEEVIPEDELVLEETELDIPEENQKKEDLIVEQITAEKSLGEELLIPELSSDVESQRDEEIFTEEVIICEEGIEDWVQNEEIIQSNEEEEHTEDKQLEMVEEANMEENCVESEEQFDEKKIQESNEPNKQLEKKKLLMEKRKKKLERFKKLKHLDIKQTTETFLNDEKRYSYPDDELKSSVEEKELFMNPENPDTIEYNKNSSDCCSDSVIKRRVSYGDYPSPKIDFKAPKRRYSTMESSRSVKKPIINLDEISKNITEVLENLTKQETCQYQQLEKIKIERKLDVKKDEIKTETKEKEAIEIDSNDIKEEKKCVSIKNETPVDVNNFKSSESKRPRIEETNKSATEISENAPNITKLVEQLIKPKLIIPKTNYSFVATQENKPTSNRKPSLPKTPEEDNSSPVVNTARLTEPIFPKSSKPTVSETIIKPKNVDPRIERPREHEKEEKLEKPYLIENKFSLTEYTKNYIKMKTGQSINTKNVCGVNGTKIISKSGDKTVTEDKVKKLQNLDNEDSKLSERKVKINLQDYRNRKQSLSSSDLNASSTENSVSSPQIEDMKKYSEVEKLQIKNVDNEIPDRKVEKLIIKPKKSLDSISKDPLLIPKVTNSEEPKETNNTNKVDCKNLQNVNSKSKIDLKHSKPKKRKKRFRNLYTVDEEDEVPTKQQKNFLHNETNGSLTNDDSTSSKVSEDSSSKANEDSQSSEMSGSTTGEFLCCLDMNSNGSSEDNCAFKCHINLNAIGEKIRDYEINKNSSCNSNKLKLTLKPVKKKKPAFSDVLSNLDSLVESELLSKRHKKKLNSKTEKNGDGTLWTINNKVPKVIIKRNGSGYCAVFRDVSSNPIWQPKIRLKRQKYIESLVLRSNVKV